MAQSGERGGPTQELARRVKEVRRKRGLSGAALAERMTKLGVKWDRSIVANLEGGRRKLVTVDELLALALALNVAPVHLLVPPDDPDEDYAVTPSVMERRFSVRAWIRGIGPLGADADEREFYSEVPLGEFYSPGWTRDDGTWVPAVQQGPPRRSERPL